VLIINQSRNAHRPLAASEDIVPEMAVPRGLGLTRRRTFTGVGRYPETLQAKKAELNREGTDYSLLPETPPPPPPILATLQCLLAESPVPLTHRDLRARWPGDPPHPDALSRILAAGLQRGLFTATGKGTKTDPLRFALVTQATSTDRPPGELWAPANE
jgi:hypothetical protein